MEIHLQGYADPPKKNNQIIQALILWQLSSLTVRWSKIRSLETLHTRLGRPGHPPRLPLQVARFSCPPHSTKPRDFLKEFLWNPKKNCLGEMCWIVLEMTGICVFWLLDWSCVMLLQVDLLYILYQIYVKSVLLAHFTSYLHEISWNHPVFVEVTVTWSHIRSWPSGRWWISFASLSYHDVSSRNPPIHPKWLQFIW